MLRLLQIKGTLADKLETKIDALITRIDAMGERLETKIDALENKLVIMIGSVEERLTGKIIASQNATLKWIIPLLVGIMGTLIGILFKH